MGINKTKKKATTRFNVIDLIIIILALACIAGIYIRYASLDDINAQAALDSAQVSFLVQDIRNTSAKFFENAEKEVYFADEKVKFGEFMRGFTITPAEKYMTDESGNVYKAVYPENTRIDVRGKILSEGRWTDTGFYVDGSIYIAPGKEIKIATSDITVTLIVTEVTKNAQ